MFYDFSFTIPKNTSKSSPAELDCKLTHGIIHRVEVGFPAGCAGLVHCVIKEGLHQHWPTNPDGDFKTDRFTIGFNEHLEFTRKPYILTLVGWSFDDTFPHTLEVRIGILPAWVLSFERFFITPVRRITERLGL